MNLNRVVLLLLFVVAIFSLITMNSSHSWGDDFAMYLMHAENIATGKPYAETGYIYNELAPTYAPQSYPPGFPLLLAIVQPFFGLNFLAYKIYILLFFLIFLWLAYVWLKDKVDGKYVVGIIALLGFAPFIWQLRDSILSDIPGATFTMAALVMYEKAMKSTKWVHFLILAFLIYFTYAIRTIGIVLLPAVLFAAAFTRPQKWLRILITIPLFLLFTWIQSKLFVQGESYFGIVLNIYAELTFGEVLSMMGYAVQLYFNSFSDFFIGSYHNIFTNSLAFYIGMTFFLIGFLKKTFKKIGITEFLFLGNLIIILLWPSYQGLRFFLPLLPLYLYYIVYGFSIFKTERLKNAITGFYILLALLSFVSFYTNKSFKGDEYGLTGKESNSVLQFIKESTGENDVIMASKPRAVCLVTGRKSIVYPDVINSNKLWQNIKENKVNYLLLNSYPNYPTYLDTGTVNSNNNLKKVYENKEWLLYQINNVAQ